MNILHINSQDDGGAAVASLNLHKALLNNKVNSYYLSMDNNYNLSDINYVFRKNESVLNPFFLFKRHLIPQFYKRKFKNKLLTSEHFSFPYSMIDITTHPFYKNADIIHFHNIAEFVDIPSFLKKNDKPIVVTLHDFFFLNGLFHIYEKKQLNKVSELLLDKNKKLMEEFIKKDIKIIAPSNSVKKAAFRINSLFTDNIEIIYHGIDKNKFYKLNKEESKKALNIDISKNVILIVADNFSRANKNFKRAIDEIANSNLKDIQILTIGNNYESIQNDKLAFTNIPFSNKYSMNEIYSASDVTLVPSLFETFSLVSAESISCGAPVVAFNNSGPSEIISHLENGYLAKYEDYTDFSKGIEYCLTSLKNKELKQLDEEFSIEYSTEKYLEVYKRLEQIN